MKFCKIELNNKPKVERLGFVASDWLAFKGLNSFKDSEFKFISDN
jgi:hypothetical protein